MRIANLRPSVSLRRLNTYYRTGDCELSIPNTARPYYRIQIQSDNTKTKRFANAVPAIETK